jgi:hypothetical protein
MLHCDLFVSHTILADMLSGVSSPASSPPSSTEQKFVQSSRSGLLLLVVLVASRSTLVKYYITNVSFNPNYHPISDIQTLTVLTFNSKVASSSATMIDRGCCCKHERVHMWLTPPSIAFCKATALLAPVAMMTTSLAWFCRQYIVTDQHKRNIMGVVTNLHDGLNSHRQRHLGYSMQVSPEKPSIRSHRLFRQSLHSCPRHHAGPGLVESDMPTPPRNKSIPPTSLILASNAAHSVSRSGALPLRMCTFSPGMSICEKRFENMKEWYDSGWSRGRSTYSSCGC